MALLLALSLLLLAGFAVIGSFHDAPNAIAVAVRTRALTATTALALAAVCTAIGFGVGLATLPETAHDWLRVPSSTDGLGILTAILATAILWELATWWRAMPSSSTHALIGALLGAGWAARAVDLDVPADAASQLLASVWLPLVAGPLLAYAVSWLAAVLLVGLLRHASPRTVNDRSRYLLCLSAAVVSLSHGMYFGHRLLLLGGLLLGCAGITPPEAGPATLAAGAVLCGLMVLGTLGGGWRIARTLATRMVQVDPFRGAVAMTTTSLLSLGTGAVLREPYSSSHLSAAAVLGAGSTQRFTAVRSQVAGRIVLTWLLTVPVCAVLAAVLLLALSPLL
ncbi:inorganic phosphate transporter [Rothia kristinae]|uniref:Inorganic phosphate transporter n=1 Tax=Rothia kristinae TaxID=37923 RepID=A0A7T3CGB9_9MICC|nr:inorganic phosphate transporter [Rothia kristinae]QPT52839.1 inorganic phosphate transporter [Rothia kristinae]